MSCNLSVILKKLYVFTSSVLLFCSFLLTRTSRTPTIEFQAFIQRCLKTSDIGLNFNTCLNKRSVLERVAGANRNCFAPSNGCSTFVSLIQEWNISSKPEWFYSPQTKGDHKCGENRPQSTQLSHCVSSNAWQKNISCQCFSTKCCDSGPNLHTVASWSPTDPLQGKDRTCCDTGNIHPPDVENSEGWSIAGLPPVSDLPSSPYRFSESTRGSVPCYCWPVTQGERGVSTGQSRHQRPQQLWQLAFRILYISCTEYVFWQMNRSPWCEGRHIRIILCMKRHSLEWTDSCLDRLKSTLSRTAVCSEVSPYSSSSSSSSFLSFPRWKCLLLKLILT